MDNAKAQDSNEVTDCDTEISMSTLEQPKEEGMEASSNDYVAAGGRESSKQDENGKRKADDAEATRKAEALSSRHKVSRHRQHDGDAITRPPNTWHSFPDDAKTSGKAAAASSTPSPTISQEFVSLQTLIESVSLDGGVALSDPSSPQYKALVWLSQNTLLEEYPDWRRLQRYVLAVVYYSTNGDDWKDKTRWLSDENECTWANFAQEGLCNDDGVLNEFAMQKNNLNGTIPVELVLMSDLLCKFHDSVCKSLCICFFHQLK